MLLTHPDIADTAVIGVDSAKEATELPRAYVVHVNPNAVKTPEQKAAFAQSIQQWIQTKVARHKFLRGGVSVIDAIPKRYDSQTDFLRFIFDAFSVLLARFSVENFANSQRRSSEVATLPTTLSRPSFECAQRNL